MTGGLTSMQQQNALRHLRGAAEGETERRPDGTAWRRVDPLAAMAAADVDRGVWIIVLQTVQRAGFYEPPGPTGRLGFVRLDAEASAEPETAVVPARGACTACGGAGMVRGVLCEECGGSGQGEEAEPGLATLPGPGGIQATTSITARELAERLRAGDSPLQEDVAAAVARARAARLKRGERAAEDDAASEPREAVG